MLNRQRIVLALLDRVGEPIQHTMLVKLAFLLRHETVIERDRTFYHFVPYKQGPFSFALYRELEVLERDGYVERGDHSIGLGNRARDFARDQVERLTPAQSAAVTTVVESYSRKKRPALLRSVYSRYPWYASKSELSQYAPETIPAPPKREPAAYTVGYEGKSVDEFFNGLLESGMEGIIDVRANPASRKYGFARKSMSRIAGHLDLSYFHIPELGITGDRRADLSDFASYQRLLDLYESELLPDRSAQVERAIELLSDRPLALLCMEKDVRCCHRGRLANWVARQSSLAVEHL